MERLARLFREPTDGGAAPERATTAGAPTDDPPADAPAGDGAEATEATEATEGVEVTEGRDGSAASGGEGGDGASDARGSPADGGGTDAAPGDPAADTDAVAVVVQAPSAGVRRFELTVRAGAPVAGVDPGLLTSLFESFDDGGGVVRARAVDVDGKGKEVEAAAPLFTFRFAEAVDPESVAVDGSIDGHDEEPVPWSRVRLTPVD
jgi:hypothetical protein